MRAIALTLVGAVVGGLGLASLVALGLVLLAVNMVPFPGVMTDGQLVRFLEPWALGGACAGGLGGLLAARTW